MRRLWFYERYPPSDGLSDKKMIPCLCYRTTAFSNTLSVLCHAVTHNAGSRPPATASVIY